MTTLECDMMLGWPSFFLSRIYHLTMSRSFIITSKTSIVWERWEGSMPETPAESMKPAGAGERRHHPCGQSGPLYTYNGWIESNSGKPSSMGTSLYLQMGMRTTRQRNLAAMKDRIWACCCQMPRIFKYSISTRGDFIFIF